MVYDVTDDWSAAGGAAAWLERVRRDDAAMSEAADAVVVCSAALAEAREATCAGKLHVVPNGVDLGHFQEVDTVGVHPEVAAIPGPRLGYSGTAHPDRLDVGLVEAVAKARPGWSWLFVGPSHLRAADRARLDLPNVHFLGPRAYAELPGFLAGVDVCLTPHRVTNFTESLNPIKLWEYLAVGRPIVSTAVAGFRAFGGGGGEPGGLVRLAGDAAAWVSAVEAALAEGPEKTAARRARVATEGWSARVDRLEAILRGEAGVMPAALHGAIHAANRESIAGAGMT